MDTPVANSNSRAFKGVWIPASIWLNENLTLQEKVMLVEIDSLQHPERGCFKSNRKFGEFFGLSESRVSEVITSLTKKGYIRTEVVWIHKPYKVRERRIYMVASLESLANAPEQAAEDLRDVEDPSSRKAKTHLRDPEDPSSRKAMQSNTGVSNTVEVVQGLACASATPTELPPDMFGQAETPPPKARGRKPKRMHDMPEDFQPDSTCMKLAYELKIPVLEELEKFKDYCAAVGKQYKDWQAGFRTWIRNADKFRPNRSNYSGDSASHQKSNVMSIGDWPLSPEERPGYVDPEKRSNRS